MAIDELTDEALFDLYKRYPEVREIVDGIQKRYNVHWTQKGKSGYNEENISIAAKEAKEAVKQLFPQQKQTAAGAPSPSRTGVFSREFQYVTAGALTAVLLLYLL